MGPPNLLGFSIKNLANKIADAVSGLTDHDTEGIKKASFVSGGAKRRPIRNNRITGTLLDIQRRVHRVWHEFVFGKPHGEPITLPVLMPDEHVDPVSTRNRFAVSRTCIRSRDTYVSGIGSSAATIGGLVNAESSYDGLWICKHRKNSVVRLVSSGNSERRQDRELPKRKIRPLETETERRGRVTHLVFLD